MSPRSFSRSWAKSSVLMLVTAALFGVVAGEARAENPRSEHAEETEARESRDAVDLVLDALDAAAAQADSAEPAANGPSCSYTLVQAPPEGERLCVYFDEGRQVPENSRNGWTYSRARNAVTFHGSSCEGIQSGRVRDVDIVCGCER